MEREGKKIAYFEFSPRVEAIAGKAMERIAPRFKEIDSIAAENTEKVLAAFQKYRVSDSYFAGTTGYGYDDKGRDMLEAIYAEVFGTEAALVRIGFVNGTHAIATALFSALRPGDTLLSSCGTPYDTLCGVIGISDKGSGSLKYYGINYKQLELTQDGRIDLAGLAEAAAEKSVKAVLIQRSRGYSSRPAFSLEEIKTACETVRKANPDAAVIVDNCYGEFTQSLEPTQLGADLAAGSLIKNPGGGIAPTGGYIVGKKELVDSAARRLTVPGIGGECGSTLGMNRLLYQGFFLAPHVTAQAMKTAVFCAAVMEELGFRTDPSPEAARSDIIQRIEFGRPEALCAFCRGIQKGSPVDSFVTPEPWEMPGYDHEVIMAAGAFIQGSSIELSADGPMREPYAAFMQGGITFESGRIGIMLAAQEIMSALGC